MRVLALLVTLVAVAAAPANAQLVRPDGSRSAYHFPNLMPWPPGPIVVHGDGACGGARLSCAWPGHMIFDWPRTVAGQADGRHGALSIFFHEIGHHFDYSVMTDRWRIEFMRAAFLGGPWYPTGREPPREPFAPRAHSSPHETFAQAYAVCAMRKRVGYQEPEAGYGYRPTPRKHRRVCRIIERAASG